MFCTSSQGNLKGKGYNFIKQDSAMEDMIIKHCTSTYSHFLPCPESSSFYVTTYTSTDKSMLNLLSSGL
jgi:hypothetical protein